MEKRKRFNLNLALTVNDVKDGVEEKFMDSSLNYFDLPMEGMLTIEKMLIEMMEKLNDIGIIQAESKGENLSMLTARENM